MKQAIAEILARSPLLREIVISKTDTSGGWAVALSGVGGSPITPTRTRAFLETARGEIRIFKSLDTAQAWVAALLGEDRDPSVECGVTVQLQW